MNLDYSLLIPEYLLAALAAAVVALGLYDTRRSRTYLPYVSAGGLAGILIVSLFYINKGPLDFAGLVQVDNYTTFFRVLFISITAVVCLASAHFVRNNLRHAGEYYGLLILSTIGAIYMAAGRELITAYISLELLSFSLYVLVSFAKMDAKSNEGGMKYMLLGAFSSALFLYGLSLIYGVSGSTSYADINAALAAGTSSFSVAMLMGLVLIIAGIGFKVSAVPFHMWAPDAYEGAPLPITAYLSAASKAAGIALLLRLFSEAFLPVLSDWRWMIAALAAMSMTLGNLVAIQQHNIKRLLAYSSIGQAGFMLMGIAALSQSASSALLLHMTGYVITNLAAFVVIIAFYDATGKDEVADYRGLAERAPFLALSLTVALFSLAGMPLFAGFATKFLLFQAVANEGFLWLAGLAVVNSLISLYYYLVVIRQMYVGEHEDKVRLRVPLGVNAVILGLVVGVFVVGLYPQPLFKATDEAVHAVFASQSLDSTQSPPPATSTPQPQLHIEYR
jgi:NADH-quinone oxidoreductase subunit N